MATKKKPALKAKAGTATSKASGPAAKKVVAKKGFPAKKAGAKPAAKRKGPPPGQFWFQAPADFKPHDLLVAIRTEKDGLLSTGIKAVRYVGRYSPEAEDKKKFDMDGYDQKTLIGLQARLAMRTFKTNGQKVMPHSVKERNVTTTVKNAAGEPRPKYTFGSGFRLPANTAFYILMRVGRRTADNVLTVSIKSIEQAVKIDKNGVKKSVKKLLDKKDPAYRLIVSGKRFLPAAFQNVMAPPKRTRGANKPKDTDGDDE